MVFKIYMAIFLSALILAEPCVACKNPECICDAYELMLQNREKYEQAIELLGIAIKLIKSAKSHDKKLLKTLKSFYKRSCAELKKPLPEFIQYTGGD